MTSIYSARTGPLALVLLVLACDGTRERPSLVGPEVEAHLSVQLVAPSTNETVIAGAPLAIRVRGSEPSGLLAAVGYYIHRIGPGRPVVDSAFVSLSAVSDTIVTFSFIVPDTLPNNAQLDLIGIAVGPPGTERRASNPRGVVVIQCTPGAIYC